MSLCVFTQFYAVQRWHKSITQKCIYAFMQLSLILGAEVGQSKTNLVWLFVVFLQSSSFWEASPALIGQLSSALWLAKYLKSETDVTPPYRIVMASLATRLDNKIHYSGDIITDYNDLYCVFTHWITLHKHYHVYIRDQRNDKQQALLYTAQNSRLNRQ